MDRFSALEMFLGLVCRSSVWQGLVGAVGEEDARGAIHLFGEDSDGVIAAGWCVGYARVVSRRVDRVGEPGSFDVGGEFLFAVEFPRVGPEGSFGWSLGGGRDLEDGYVEVVRLMEGLAEDVMDGGNEAGGFRVVGWEEEDVSLSHWVKGGDRWRFNVRVRW